MRAPGALLALVALASTCALALAETELVGPTSATRWLANTADPGLGTTWTQETFSDASWSAGRFGVGYDANGTADPLLDTDVPRWTTSVYTRTTFDVADPAAIATLRFAADWDDGIIAWINGIEAWRSPEMPAGAPAWDTFADSHESTNAIEPVLPLEPVAPAALAAIHAGTNVLAIGAWNDDPSSTDLVLVPRLVADPDLVVTRGPYLQSATPTSMVIRWRTSLASGSTVSWGSRPGSLDRTITDGALATEHAVRLTGLAPATRYVYAVGSPSGVLAGDDDAHAFTTPPPAGTRAPFRAWVLGDSGSKNADAARVRDAFTAMAAAEGVPADLVLMLGDNAYESGTDAETQAAIFDMYRATLRAVPLWPTLGNHDAVNADSTTQTGVYYDAFTLPRGGECGGVSSGTEAWYSFDVANVHFVCLDSEDSDRSPTGLMVDWLRRDLAATDRDWIVAYFHHPPYTKGSHDSDTQAKHVEMRQASLPVLEAGGVDLVLGGHSHVYERSYLLDGHYGLSTTLTPAMLLDAGDGDEAGDGAYVKRTAGLSPNEGAVYVVAGSSGKVTSGGTLDHPAMYVSMVELGSVVLDVDGLVMRARFLDDAGAWRDAFTIEKGETRCADAADDDSDGLRDCEDPDCPLLDADGDGAGECVDCAPSDPGSRSVPVQIARLDVRKPFGVPRSDVAVLSWPDPATAGTSTRVDVASGRIGALRPDRGPTAGATCLVRGAPGTTWFDLTPPPGDSDGWWYLARARNTCGSGPWRAALGSTCD